VEAVSSAVRDRLRAAALGAALGDALGMPLEFGPAQPLTALVREMHSGRLPAGSFTDDTEMALALAESLLAFTPLNPQDLADRFVDWLGHNPPDVGNQTYHILNRMRQGLDWEAASLESFQRNPNSSGNGSVMRCWPVALARCTQPQQLIADSRLQSRVTHPAQDCQDACALVNWMIRELAFGASPEQALDSALGAVSVSAQALEMLRRAPQQPCAELKNSGWVLHTLESAVWGLMTTHSFEEAVVQVANLGEDADTAAAVTGALAGAAYGLDAIPPRWRKALRGEWPLDSGEIWDAPRLLRLADDLLALNASA